MHPLSQETHGVSSGHRGTGRRGVTNHDQPDPGDPKATDLPARSTPTLLIRATGVGDSLDPVRYWSVFAGEQRIGRICLICLPDHVGAVLGLWVEPGHACAATACQMLIDTAHRGLHRAACVKVIADASVVSEPAWEQVVASGSLTPRPGRVLRRWHEYYVNIYQRNPESIALMRDARPHPPATEHAAFADALGWRIGDTTSAIHEKQ